MTRRPARWAIVMLALAAASCSGGDKTADDTTVAPTTVAPSTTAPSTTAAPATTAPTTTAAQTTPAPTTPTTPAPTTPPTTASLDPIADLAAALQRDAQAGEDVLMAVLADPNASDAEARLRRYYTASALESTLAVLADFRTNNYTIQPNPDVPNVLVITGEPQIVSTDPTRAQVTTCRVDAGIVLAPADQGGIRLPINNEILRTEATSTFTLVDGIWQIEGGQLISETPGAVSCA